MREKLEQFLAHPMLSAPVLILALFGFRLIFSRVVAKLMPDSIGILAFSELIYWLFTIIFLAIWVVYLSRRGRLLPESGLLKHGGPLRNLPRILIMFLPGLVYASYMAFGKCLVNNGTLTWDGPWFFYAASIAISAGVAEEIMCRGIPMGNGMRNIHSRKQMLGLLFLTSAVFGMLHITNLLDGSDLTGVMCQALHATGMGFFFGALYLRTGSIIPSIVMHTIHDFLLFYAPYLSLEETVSSPLISEFNITGQAVSIIAAFTAMWILISLFMLRKSKWNIIQENFEITE